MANYKFVVINSALSEINGGFPPKFGPLTGIATPLLGEPLHTRYFSSEIEASSPSEAAEVVNRRFPQFINLSNGISGLFVAETDHVASKTNRAVAAPCAHVIALLNALPGRESEFEHWHTYTHFQDVMGMPGWIAAQRFTQLNVDARLPGGEFHASHYLVIYDLLADNVPEAVDFAFSRLGTPEIPNSEAADSTNMLIATYLVPLTQRGATRNH